MPSSKSSRENGKLGGRPKGKTNQGLLDIRALASVHGPMAIARLVELAGSGEGHVAVSACKELLDRGFGRAPQPHDGDGAGGPVKFLIGWEK